MDTASYGHKTATTINGVVINIHGDSHSTKVGKRVRREASFRVPPPPSFNGSGRATSPTLSSASGSPYPAPPISSVPVESARARALQVRRHRQFHVFFSNFDVKRVRKCCLMRVSKNGFKFPLEKKHICTYNAYSLKVNH